MLEKGTDEDSHIISIQADTSEICANIMTTWDWNEWASVHTIWEQNPASVSCSVLRDQHCLIDT
jgi:hypothetical protein